MAKIKLRSACSSTAIPIFYLFALIFIRKTDFVSGDRTRQKIYVDFPAIRACFRRLNGTHQIGCQSERGGNVGVVHYVNNRTSLDWLLDRGPHSPYVALLHPAMFTAAIIKKMIHSKKVNGILVEHTSNTTSPASGSFSPDKTCPNAGYGVYSKDEQYADCHNGTWNEVGNGLMFEDFNLPIVAMTNSTHVQTLIKDCYMKYNEPDVKGGAPSYPLCAVEVKDRMDAAKDSETCIRRSNLIMNLNPAKYCDPLGDYSVIATLQAINNTQTRPNKSIIVASARMDSFSLFDNLYPSADSAVSGLVALLAAAEAIGKVKSDIQAADKDILFTVFNGEAFDYIGSSRVVYEMQNGHFPVEAKSDGDMAPINSQHISHFLEVSQVGLHSGASTGEVWMHTDPLSLKNQDVKKEVKKIEDAVLTSSADLQLNVASTPQVAALPPASVQSFLKKAQLPALVLGNHRTHFTNKFYNSRFDVAEHISADYPPGMSFNDTYDYVTHGSQHLQQVATLVARSLYTLATGNNQTGHIQANNSTVAHLLYCFLYRQNCDLFLTVIDPRLGKSLAKVSTPLSFYVGVVTSRNLVTTLTHNLLAYYLGNHRSQLKKDQCKAETSDKVNKYLWLQGPVNETTNQRDGLCVVSSAMFVEAKSPAFIIKNYDWKSGEYSTWTESIWQNDAINLRAYLKPSKTREALTLVMGIVIFLVSLVAAYFLNRRSSLLFCDSQTPFE